MSLFVENCDIDKNLEIINDNSLSVIKCEQNLNIVIVDNMRKIFLVLCHIIIANFHISHSVVNREKDLTSHCFKFTWLSHLRNDVEHNETDCSTLIHNPCFEPFIFTNDSNIPNPVYLWENRGKLDITCPLRPGYTCIKYTYSYDNAVINSTHYCGKMIEDKASPITNGCYIQQVNGHKIEACACRSDGGRLPCNSSKKHQYHLILITLIFILQIL